MLAVSRRRYAEIEDKKARGAFLDKFCALTGMGASTPSPCSTGVSAERKATWTPPEVLHGGGAVARQGVEAGGDAPKGDKEKEMLNVEIRPHFI